MSFDDIERVGKLIGFPVAAKKKEADLTIKVPKTWGAGLDVHTLETVGKLAAAKAPKGGAK